MKLNIIIGILVFTNVVFSQNNLTNFTGAKINEQVKLYSDSVRYSAHIYLFFKADECTACFSHIRYISQLIGDKSKINMIGFLEGQSQEFADKFKQVNNFDFPVVGDKISLYKNFYKAKALPIYYILNRSGFLVAADKCGGTGISDTELNNIVKELKVQQANNIHGLPNLKERKRITINNNNGQPLVIGKFLRYLEDRINSHLLIMDSESKEIITLDSNYKLINRINLLNLSSDFFEIRQPLNISWIKEGETLLYCDVDRRYHYSLAIIQLDSLKLENISYNYTWPPYNVANAFYFPFSKNIILCLNRSSFTNEPSLISNEFHTLMAIDLSGNEIKKFGTPNELFQEYKVSKVFSNKFTTFYNDLIFELQTPSKFANIYNSSLNLVKQIELSYDSSFRILDFDLDTSDNKQDDYRNWNSKVSIGRDIKFFDDGNLFCFIYSNVEYSEGIIDPRSENALRKRFLFVGDLSGNNLFSKDIQIPDNSKLISIDGNIIKLMEQLDNRLDCVEYEIVME